MSASDTINSILNVAKSEAVGTVEAAKSLVAEAVTVLNQYRPVYPRAEVVVSESGMSSGGGFSAEEKPPQFPGIREPDLPPDPVLQDLDMVDARFDKDAPAVHIPDFTYAEPSALAPFTERAPDIDARVAVPPSPALVWPERPALDDVDSRVVLEPMVVPPLDVETPKYVNPFAENWWYDFDQGAARAPSIQALAPVLLDRYFPGVQASYLGLVERVNGILEGRATALTDPFDQHLYDQLRRRVEAERGAGYNRVTDAAHAAGWGLPGRVIATLRAEVDAAAATSLNGAALEVYTKRAERELQHLQFVMELAAKLHGAALQFVVQATDAEISSFRAALAFADSASGFAVKVYELRQRDFEIETRLVDSAVAVFEARLRAEQAKGELARLRLEIAKLQREGNREQIALYTAELGANETRVKVFTEEINALEAALRVRKFPLDLFEAKLRAHIASTEAKKSEYMLLEAQIGADKAKVDGELAKVRVYEADAQVFKTRIDAQVSRLEGQSKYNDQQLEQFRTKVDAQLKLVQVDEAMAKHALDTYEAMAKVFVAEAQQKLAESESAFKKTIEQARLDRDVLEFDFNRQFHNITLEMRRLQFISEALMSSAKVHGDMANSALSALNGVVSVAQTEQV